MTPSALPPALRRPVRLSITLPFATYQLLAEHSAHDGRSMSNLAAHLLELALHDRPCCGCQPAAALR